jgi:hypothetical protein
MFTYYYPLKGHTAGDDLNKVRAIDARIEADTYSTQIIVVNLPVIWTHRFGYRLRMRLLGRWRGGMSGIVWWWRWGSWSLRLRAYILMGIKLKVPFKVVKCYVLT